TQLVRCTLRARRGGTSSRPHREGVGAGRGGGGSSVTAGAWVTGGPVWGLAPPRPRSHRPGTPANSYLRTQLVRCTLRARRGRTSSLACPTCVRRARPARGAWVGRGTGGAAGPAPVGARASPPRELVPPHPARTVHATSSARAYEFVARTGGGGAGLCGGGRVVSRPVASGTRAGLTSGVSRPRSHRPGTPASSYLRTQLVRCTLRARRGGTSSPLRWVGYAGRRSRVVGG